MAAQRIGAVVLLQRIFGDIKSMHKERKIRILKIVKFVDGWVGL